MSSSAVSSSSSTAAAAVSGGGGGGTTTSMSRSTHQDESSSSSSRQRKKKNQQPPSSGSSVNQAKHQDMLEYIVTKRVKNLNYIRRIHEGNAYWLNVVRISPEDIVRYYHMNTLQKRVQQWFYMGVSIAPLLHLDSGWSFVRACSQLMEEFEYHFSNAAVQGMKMLKALATSATEVGGGDGEQPRAIRPTIAKVGGQVVYEFLRTPNIPCELDYCQVVFSMCDILTLVYRKLLDDSGSSGSLHESIIKLDGKFKHHFFGLISRDLNTLAMHVIKNKLSTLEEFMSGRDNQPLFAVETEPSNQISNMLDALQVNDDEVVKDDGNADNEIVDREEVGNGGSGGGDDVAEMEQPDKEQATD